MHHPDLVFGLRNTSAQINHPRLAQKLRSLTVSWTRYDYHGPIIENENIDSILQRAIEQGYRYCLVLDYGQVVVEFWSDKTKNFAQQLSDWIKNNDFLAASSEGVVLVDLQSYQLLTNSSSLQTDPRSTKFPKELRLKIKNLAQHQEQLLPYLDDISKHPANSPDQNDCTQFLASIVRQTENVKHGVFLWNLEPYDDVTTPPQGYTPPISALYSVAAGLKPNMILHTHHVDENSKVVFFDYSNRALQVKQTLLNEWDGEDYPRFIKYLFKKYPYPETFYHLCEDLSPEQICWQDMDKYWQQEITKWGGEKTIYDLWQVYKKLPHEYVLCDLLTQQSTLLDRITTEPNSVIWWSNAFFTFYSNWHYSVEQRKEIFDSWLRGLAAKNPQIFVYGADYNNNSINCIQAAECLSLYTQNENGNNCLEPCNVSKHTIRF